jgi:hypothetical protein
MELKEWFTKVETSIQNARDAGAEIGACMIPDPNGGPPMCVPADKTTCTSVLGGTFVGGDCGV